MAIGALTRQDSLLFDSANANSLLANKYMMLEVGYQNFSTTLSKGESNSSNKIATCCSVNLPESRGYVGTNPLFDA